MPTEEEENVAVPLADWLAQASKRFGVYRTQSVCIVAVLGKSMPGELASKCQPLMNKKKNNHLWRNRVGNGDGDIEAYFDAEQRVVYLHLIGTGDLDVIEALLLKGKGEEDNDGEECSVDNGEEDTDRFVQALSSANIVEQRRLLLLVHISHIILVVEPVCRVDCTLARKLRITNVLRNYCQSRVHQLLSSSTSTSLPSSLCRAARLCTPRLLFAVHRGSVRPDMSLAKRVDILNRLTDRFEDQIYAHYRKCRVVTNNPSFSAIAIPPNDRFVYIFDPAADNQRQEAEDDLSIITTRNHNNDNPSNPGETITNPLLASILRYPPPSQLQQFPPSLQNLYDQFGANSNVKSSQYSQFDPTIPPPAITPIMIASLNQQQHSTYSLPPPYKKPPASYPVHDRFAEFLQVHIEAVLTNEHGFDDRIGQSASSKQSAAGGSAPHFLTPSLKTFIRMTKIITHSSSPTQQYFMNDESLTKRLDTMVNPELAYSESVCAKLLQQAYEFYCAQMPPIYPRRAHQAKLQECVSYLYSHHSGSRTHHYVGLLATQCTRHWIKSRRQCDAISFTAHNCAKMLHKTSVDDEAMIMDSLMIDDDDDSESKNEKQQKTTIKPADRKKTERKASQSEDDDGDSSGNELSSSPVESDNEQVEDSKKTGKSKELPICPHESEARYRSRL